MRGRRKEKKGVVVVVVAFGFLLSRTFLLAPPNYIGEEARGRHPLLRIPDKIESKKFSPSLSLSLSLSLCVCVSIRTSERKREHDANNSSSVVSEFFTATVRGKSATTATASHFQNAQRHDNNRYQQRRKRNAFVITRANAQNNDDGKEENLFTTAEKLLEKAGVSMGPICHVFTTRREISEKRVKVLTREKPSKKSSRRGGNLSRI